MEDLFLAVVFLGFVFVVLVVLIVIQLLLWVYICCDILIPCFGGPGLGTPPSFGTCRRVLV